MDNNIYRMKIPDKLSKANKYKVLIYLSIVIFLIKIIFSIIEYLSPQPNFSCNETLFLLNIFFNILVILHIIFSKNLIFKIKYDLVISGIIDLCWLFYLIYNNPIHSGPTLIFAIVTIQLLINIFIINSNVLRVAIYLFFFPFAYLLFIFFTRFELYFSIIIWTLLILYDYIQNNIIKRERVFLHYMERQFQIQKSKNQFTSTQTALIRHDLNNQIQAMHMKFEIMLSKGEITNENFKFFMQYLEKTSSLLSALKNQLITQFNILETIQNLVLELDLSIEYFEIDPTMNEEIRFDNKLFKSIIFNLIQNSFTAYQKKYNNLQGLKIKFFLGKDETIYIEDNAGGCDLNAIKAGNSSNNKNKLSHGYFLYTLLNEGLNFNIKSNIESVPDGLRFSLKFLES